jgi:23S rRNA pseudouridine1911/1915/1917 synthase
MGQRAVTHVRLLEPLGKYSLVECRLETGRTNQIRIHMAEAGHLVCGDPKYDQPYGSEALQDTSGAPRLALHAAELGFVHPTSG